MQITATRRTLHTKSRTLHTKSRTLHTKLPLKAFIYKRFKILNKY